jgi:hypothetical protein
MIPEIWPSTVRAALAAFAFGLAQVATWGSARAADQVTLNPCPDNAARVILFHSGAVTLNGERVAATSIVSAIAALRPIPKVICYAQENKTDQANPQISQDVAGLMFLGFGLTIYTDTTFTMSAFSNPPRVFRRKESNNGSAPLPGP